MIRVYFDTVTLWNEWPKPTGAFRQLVDVLLEHKALLCLPELVQWELESHTQNIARDIASDLKAVVERAKRFQKMAISFDVDAALAMLRQQERETIAELFTIVPIPADSVGSLLRDSALHVPPFKGREKGTSADRAFRDSVIQKSMVLDFESNGGGIGLIVSRDGGFTDAVAQKYLGPPGLRVVATVAEAVTYLQEHFAEWLSASQAKEQKAVRAAVEQLRNELSSFLRSHLRVPSGIASPGDLLKVDDVSIAGIRSVVANMMPIPPQDPETAGFVVDLELDVRIVERPAIWHPSPMVGLNESVPLATVPKFYASRARVRVVEGYGWVSGSYELGTDGEAHLTFENATYGNWQRPFEEVLADELMQSRYVTGGDEE